MTGTVSPQIPTIDSPNSTEEPKIPSAIITLRDALNAVLNSANLLDGAKLATGTVATAALADSSITTAKIGTAVINNSKFFPGAVDTAALGSDAVTNAKVADDAVDSAQIVDGAVGAAKLNLPTASDTLTTSINPLSGSLTDLCSVGVTSGGTYLVMAQAHCEALTINQTCNGHVSLTYNGAEHESNDIVFTDTAFPSFNQVVAISSGTTLKLRAKNVGANVIRVRGADGATSLTRLTVIRFNA